MKYQLHNEYMQKIHDYLDRAKKYHIEDEVVATALELMAETDMYNNSPELALLAACEEWDV